MSNTDTLSTAVDQIRTWYYTEIHSCVDAAIDACAGKLITEISPEELAQIPRKHWTSARESFVPYRIASRVRARPDGTEFVAQYQERKADQDPREFLTEFVDLLTDGHEFCIYTFKAKCAVLASDNENAYESEFGLNRTTPSVEAQCCMAMRADIWEILEARSDEWYMQDPDPSDEDDEGSDPGFGRSGFPGDDGLDTLAQIHAGREIVSGPLKGRVTP